MDADRGKPIPFFEPKPDENLASYLVRGLLAPGRALELGCGPGRNAIHIASFGFTVDAVDLSPTALAWAGERARCRRPGPVPPDRHLLGRPASRPYNLVYDSGCLHHLPPHRRVSYRDLLERVLAPGGCFGLRASRLEPWAPNSPTRISTARVGSSGIWPTRRRNCAGSSRTLPEMRPMAEQSPDSPRFGVPFLLTALFRRPKPADIVLYTGKCCGR